MARRQLRASLGTLHRELPTAVGLGLALAGSVLLGTLVGALAEPLGLGTGFADSAVRDIAAKWAVFAALLGVVFYWERRRLASIGVARMGWRDVGAAVLAFVLGAFSFVVTTPLVDALGLETTVTGIETLADLPLGLVVALALTAAVTEEVFYRGYPIERLTELTGTVWTGAGLTFLLFTLLHVPFWGLGGAIQIGVDALLLTLLYVWRRNLGACILAHALNDIYAFVVIPRFLMQYVG